MEGDLLELLNLSLAQRKHFSPETTVAWLLALRHKQTHVIPCHSWTEAQQVLAVFFLTQPSKYQQWDWIHVFSFQNYSDPAGRKAGICAKL